MAGGRATRTQAYIDTSRVTEQEAVAAAVTNALPRTRYSAEPQENHDRTAGRWFSLAAHRTLSL